MEIAFGVIILVGLLIAWESLKYSKQQKKFRQENERRNQSITVPRSKPRKKPKSSTKTVKAEVPHKNKSRKSYKKKKKVNKAREETNQSIH